MTEAQLEPLQPSTAAVDYGEHQAAMDAYRAAGEARAMALGNRGPIRYNPDGTLADDIVASYWQHGFYIFEGVIGARGTRRHRTRRARYPGAFTPGTRGQARQARQAGNRCRWQRRRHGYDAPPLRPDRRHGP